MAKNIEGFDVNKVFDDENPIHCITDNTVYGDEFYENLKELNKIRISNKKKLLLETPFVDANNDYKKAFQPIFIEIDSLSQFTASQVAEVLEKNQLGDSSTNTEALTDSRLKSQIISRMPTICARHGYYLTLCAHVGQEHKT